MSRLKKQVQDKIEAWRPRTTRLLKEFGNVKVDEVDIGQIIGGARDIKSLVTDISYLDPFEGIRFRGFTIPEVLEKLPKVPGGEMPFVEGFFFFLLTGDIPSMEDVQEVAEEFSKRHVFLNMFMIFLKQCLQILIQWLCFQLQFLQCSANQNLLKNITRDI